MRTMTILNRSGDTTITWTEDRDAKVEEWIAARMAEGYTFFFVAPPGEMRLKTFSDAVQNGRKIVLSDRDSDELLWEAGVGFAEIIDGGDDVETTGRAATPEEASQGHTVAVAPAQGG